MKNTLTTAVYVILAIAVIYVSLFFLSCNKKEISNSNHPVTSCSATKAGVEDIEIFPADNAWNKDVSHDAVDPYSSQIIASFSSSPERRTSVVANGTGRRSGFRLLPFAETNKRLP